MLTYYNVEEKIISYVKLLKNKYHVEFNYLICTWNEYIEYTYNQKYQYFCETKEKLCDSILDDSYLYNNTFIFSTYFSDFKNVIHTIFIPKENIVKLLYQISNEYKNKPNGEIIYQYIELTLQHELGHVLYINNLIDTYGISEAFSYIEKQESLDIEKYNNQLNLIDDDISEYEYQKTCLYNYYFMQKENNANKIMNIDVDNFIELELYVRFGLTENE